MFVVTRFAPSPTGFLHIGGARTALFNWLYARHTGGLFVLRIEDTDRKRSTPEAIEAILSGLRWLEIDWDGDVVHQFARAERHAEVARSLLAEGKAYLCYCTPEELEDDAPAGPRRGPAHALRRALARPRSRRCAAGGRAGRPPSRPRATGIPVIEDLVQGSVTTVANDQMDDMVLLRADGTPTYMLSVVVDDHDMGVTHVIRGDDHLTNAFRQYHLYDALGWEVPAFAHIPLIHGADGAKLSKRHGALGVEVYRDMGYLPEALRNYLLRLGWSHGDEEIISTEQAIEWFDLDAVGKAAARFDFARLDSLNGHYIRAADDGRLLDLLCPSLEAMLGQTVDDAGRERLRAALPGLKPRAETLRALAENAAFYLRDAPLPMTGKAAKLLSPEARDYLDKLQGVLAGQDDWSEAALESLVREFADSRKLKLGAIAQPLRAALTGSTASPGLFEVMAVLGRAECLNRLAAIGEYS